jgi:hypothetical protein
VSGEADNDGHDLSTLLDEIEQARGASWNALIDASGGDQVARTLAVGLHGMIEAQLIGAKATEHVAERLDKLIELMFDEHRAVRARVER